MLNGSGNGASIQQVTLALEYPALDRRRRPLPRGTWLCGRHLSDIYGDTGRVVKAPGQTLRLIDYPRIDPTPG